MHILFHPIGILLILTRIAFADEVVDERIRTAYADLAGDAFNRKVLSALLDSAFWAPLGARHTPEEERRDWMIAHAPQTFPLLLEVLRREEGTSRDALRIKTGVVRFAVLHPGEKQELLQEVKAQLEGLDTSELPAPERNYVTALLRFIGHEGSVEDESVLAEFAGHEDDMLRTDATREWRMMRERLQIGDRPLKRPQGQSPRGAAERGAREPRSDDGAGASSSGGLWSLALSLLVLLLAALLWFLPRWRAKAKGGE